LVANDQRLEQLAMKAESTIENRLKQDIGEKNIEMINHFTALRCSGSYVKHLLYDISKCLE
jgi:hypothetical protein